MDTAAVLGAAAGPRLRTDPSNVTRPHRDPAITHLCVTPVASGIRPHGTRRPLKGIWLYSAVDVTAT